MLIFKTAHGLQEYLNQQKELQSKIGFVPTMGALHLGHLTLIQTALSQNEVVVCSIFVNPTQFGDSSDLKKYPRPIKNDIQLLEKEGCSVLFLPNEGEIYPPNLKTPIFDLSGLDKGMEGAHRPGHFQGVVQVVYRLLDIVQPHQLYMGQKDYQQFAIIQYMLHLLSSTIQLVQVPIVREQDGLAMSSRNIRLSSKGRSKAALISQTLFKAKENAAKYSLEEVKKRALDFLDQQGLEVDYFEIIDGIHLHPIHSFQEASLVTACTTIKIDGVRLLDNIILKGSN